MDNTPALGSDLMCVFPKGEQGSALSTFGLGTSKKNGGFVPVCMYLLI